MSKCDTCKNCMVYQYSKKYKDMMNDAHAYGYKEPKEQEGCIFSSEISVDSVIKCSKYERKTK